ncbi:hypothetical protein [Methanosphaera sp.]
MTLTTLLPNIIIIISLVNIVLCLILTISYLRSYHKLKMKFTFGLIMFALLLLVSNIFDLNGVLFMLTNNLPMQNIYLHESLIKLVALSILSYMTLKN